jgi:hypothetical protein
MRARWFPMRIRTTITPNSIAGIAGAVGDAAETVLDRAVEIALDAAEIAFSRAATIAFSRAATIALAGADAAGDNLEKEVCDLLTGEPKPFNRKGFGFFSVACDQSVCLMARKLSAGRGLLNKVGKKDK